MVCRFFNLRKFRELCVRVCVYVWINRRAAKSITNKWTIEHCCHSIVFHCSMHSLAQYFFFSFFSSYPRYFLNIFFSIHFTLLLSPFLLLFLLLLSSLKQLAWIHVSLSYALLREWANSNCFSGEQNFYSCINAFALCARMPLVLFCELALAHSTMRCRFRKTVTWKTHTAKITRNQLNNDTHFDVSNSSPESIYVCTFVSFIMSRMPRLESVKCRTIFVRLFL